MHKNGMKRHINGDIEYYTAESFDETLIVRHCFSTRLGGVSKGCFASLNLGINRGDDKHNVLENYDIICKEIGILKEDIVLSRQTHSDEVKIVGAKERGNGLFYPNIFENADALVTNEKNVALTVFMADCVPLLFLDQKKRVIAACHSGWRGTVKHIAQKTLKVMEEIFSCDKKDILCAIGPSIGPCCFEVDRPVVDEFEKAFRFLPSEEYIIEMGGGKYNIDLWTANKELLIYSGIAEENISMLCQCTCCLEEYFSHRRDGDKRGSLAAIIELV